MKNLLGGVFTTLFLFGIGKIIYDAGVGSQKKKNECIVINVKKDSFEELKGLFRK